ncbi:hypothetical protein T4A_4563 [Trichinella pseudospiralis]|uniref:Uncharacterized protein n=1 Tax=Trichinella pseudospiralis TaxID=6337 RepID=A0A0V1DKB7_TRIPS|nr:hypothetical protein T4A_4563 [Trichinella pseudospiralis]
MALYQLFFLLHVAAVFLTTSLLIINCIVRIARNTLTPPTLYMLRMFYYATFGQSNDILVKKLIFVFYNAS